MTILVIVSRKKLNISVPYYSSVLSVVGVVVVCFSSHFPELPWKNRMHLQASVAKRTKQKKNKIEYV